MEETIYNYIKQEHIKCLSLSMILLDKGMRVKISEICSENAIKHALKYIKNDKSLMLNDDKLKEIKTKDNLEPIKIKQFKNTKYYEIIDGRHRYVYSLLSDFTSIPCIIIDDK